MECHKGHSISFKPAWLKLNQIMDEASVGNLEDEMHLFNLIDMQKRENSGFQDLPLLVD